MTTTSEQKPTATPKASLSIMVPALNEENNVEPTVHRLRTVLNPIMDDYEIILINDGSTDGTGAAADRQASWHPQVKVIHHAQRKGLGFCYQEGIAHATKNYYVFIPGDNTWPADSLAELFRHLGKADIVTSYSTNPEIRPWGRRVVSYLYTKTLNLLFGWRMHYYNGLTIYPLSFLKTSQVTTHGFGFQAEVLLQALDRGLSVVQLPLAIDDRAAGGSKAVNFKNISSVAATVVRLVWRLRLLGRLSRSHPA